jgi:hypothetical protein
MLEKIRNILDAVNIIEQNLRSLSDELCADSLNNPVYNINGESVPLSYTTVAHNSTIIVKLMLEGVERHLAGRPSDPVVVSSPNQVQ